MDAIYVPLKDKAYDTPGLMVQGLLKSLPFLSIYFGEPDNTRNEYEIHQGFINMMRDKLGDYGPYQDNLAMAAVMRFSFSAESCKTMDIKSFHITWMSYQTAHSKCEYYVGVHLIRRWEDILDRINKEEKG